MNKRWLQELMTPQNFVFYFFYPLFDEMGVTDHRTLDWAVGMNPGEEAEKELALYFHIPFCDDPCNMCMYTKQKKQDGVDRIRFIKAMKEEIVRQKNIIRGKTIKAIYIGGGTPTALSVEEIKYLLNELFDGLRQCKEYETSFDIIKELEELTFECHPQSDELAEKIMEVSKFLDDKEKPGSGKEKLRISIGIQSANDEIIKLVRHTSSKNKTDYSFLDAVKIVQDFSPLAGKVNVDFMFGIQKPAITEVKLNKVSQEWAENCEEFKSFLPEYLRGRVEIKSKDDEFALRMYGIPAKIKNGEKLSDEYSFIQKWIKEYNQEVQFGSPILIEEGFKQNDDKIKLEEELDKIIKCFNRNSYGNIGFTFYQLWGGKGRTSGPVKGMPLFLNTPKEIEEQRKLIFEKLSEKKYEIDYDSLWIQKSKNNDQHCIYHEFMYENKNYLGFGPSAYGYYNGVTYKNLDEIKEYKNELLENNGLPLKYLEVLDDDDIEFRNIVLSLKWPINKQKENKLRVTKQSNIDILSKLQKTAPEMIVFDEDKKETKYPVLTDDGGLHVNELCMLMTYIKQDKNMALRQAEIRLMKEIH